MADPSRSPRARLTGEDHALLLRLLGIPTAGPLETGDTGTVRLWEAGRAYAAAARRFGMSVVRHAAPPGTVLLRDDVPLPVREAAEDPAFLVCQPSLVLRLGPPGLPREATVMFNVHLDTVAGWWPPSFDGARFRGRGAIDAKGPAVALLAGIRAARAAEPAVGGRVGVLVQAVAGEEGGAMGTFGTRPLVEQGLVGRLNVFCEPTGHRYLPRATAAMTARVRVRGEDAVDDHPEAGHNATVLLGFLGHHLATVLPGRVPGTRVCVAGLHTGERHNKVYGSGQLLLNLAYTDPECGRAAEAALRETLREGLAAFRAGARGHPGLARTAGDAEAITSLHWLKRGLPALGGPAGDPAWAERLLESCGLSRWPAEEPAFTCDAVWMSGVPGTYTAVLGPGGLDTNRAHAEGEYADLAELDRYAGEVARLLVAFARGGRAPRPPHPSGVPRTRPPESSTDDPSPHAPERQDT
ncbi:MULTISPECIES: M20/M25/M40 family metallo-hydrolase [Streptomyces]|uniref:Acetylornithine deacetylase/Succinyl-diaminopimelate desuccinylase n=2 Tax=Streptomyces griseoaurantiacus TaxID=68213 RepID=A0A1G7MDD5_9ACTN|nr:MULTISPECIES: M20/M25/M40 family metallo-hydrolase [Streptomyces]MBA5223949.1 M20/M25/M40 family metallo-hydrolase [Streptomyces griseoaurantiacus]SDF59802.1 Acetylornithine deacetylase/Succinyl-diaminopimelate desuccinylase [Streptomyces jietaisiensis]